MKYKCLCGKPFITIVKDSLMSHGMNAKCIKNFYIYLDLKENQMSGIIIYWENSSITVNAQNNNKTYYFSDKIKLTLNQVVLPIIDPDRTIRIDLLIKRLHNLVIYS